MEIVWLGHAAFRIRSGNSSLLMDPYPPQLGLRIPPAHAQAGLVTVSNGAAEHAAVPTVAGGEQATVLRGPGEYELAGLTVKGVRVRGAASSPDTWSTVFVVEAEGLSVCHLGNPGMLPISRQIEAIGTPHILLLPIGSPGGLNAADAVEITNSLSPRIVVPMLHAHPGNTANLRPIDAFLQEMGVKAPEPQPRLTVTRNALPEETQVVVLTPAVQPA
ncbi:MAG: MBL fold metallo-hydrolase [SAR202 cluster bacterium]|nr:MBL fold metallo-hydrolase [SAR202 cluster bacterium]